MLSFTPAKSIGKGNLYLGPLHIIDRILESVMKPTTTLHRSYGDHTVIVFQANLYTVTSQLFAEVARTQYTVCTIFM